jgi:hypothetical protein
MYGPARMGDGAFSVGNPANMSYLDMACGMPLGCSGERPQPPRATSMDDALARVWSNSFGRGRCYIPFSGGPESSMWLATATRYARRNGYDDPIPVTLSYPGLATDEELRIQERVVTHLGLTDWERIEPDGGLDLIGPVAAATLVRTGPVWPANAYVMTPMIEAAQDGVFVFITGLADFFSWWMWAPLVSVIERRRPHTKRDLGLLAAGLLPTSGRARALRRRAVPPPMPWLTAEAESEAMRLLRHRQAAVPRRFDRAIVTQVTHRCFDGAAGTARAIGDAVGTSVDQPLRRPGVAESIAGAGGWRGFRAMKTMLLEMCGDLLPAEVFATRAGSDLTPLFFGDASREFAAEWSGAGLDESVVDAEALRRNWLSARPDVRSACLLQYAWLTERVSAAGSTPTDELLLTHSYTREAS